MPISVQLPDFPRHQHRSLRGRFPRLTFSGLALALEWNLQPGRKRARRRNHDLHEYVMILCTAISSGVFGFHVLVGVRAPQLEGPPGRAVPRDTTVEDAVDGDPGDHPVIIACRRPASWWRRRTPRRPTLTIKVPNPVEWAYDYIDGEGEGIGSSRP